MSMSGETQNYELYSNQLAIQYNTIQISLFHSDHTNMIYEEYNTILKGGTYLIVR